jgi:hypothetical protein
MKKYLLVYLILAANLSFSQITIDSLVIYNTGIIVDSFYLQTTTNGQIYTGKTLPVAADACGTIFGSAYFKGCETGITTTSGIMIQYGFYCKQIIFRAFWDTSYTCALPPEPISMDCVAWNQCTNWGINEEFLQEQLTVYPNPTKDVLYHENFKQISINKISLYNQYGSKIKDFGKHEEVFDLSHLAEGIFFLRIETEQGNLVEKVYRKSN